MMSPIEKYILKAIKEGYTHEQIKSALVRKGHHPYHVDKYFSNMTRELLAKNKIVYTASIFLMSLIVILFFLLSNNGISLYKANPKIILDANSLCREGNYEQSIMLFNQYLLQNEPSSEVYYFLGLCYVRQNNKNDAILYFKKALELDPNNPFIYYRLAQQQCSINDFNSAEINFDKALELDPNNQLFLQAKGSCAKRKSNI